MQNAESEKNAETICRNAENTKILCRNPETVEMQCRKWKMLKHCAEM